MPNQHKFLDLTGAQYLVQKIRGEIPSNSYINTLITNKLSEYRDDIITICSELPSEGEAGILYLIPNTDAENNHVYITYAWEVVDDTTTPKTYGFVQMGATTFTITVDSSVIENSPNPASGGAVFTALASKVNTSDIESITEPEIDVMFIGNGEIWIDASGWANMNVLYDTNSQTAPGLALTKNSYGYYVFDTSGLSTVDTFVISDTSGTNVTSQLATTLSGIIAYVGKIISVTAGSSEVTVLA